MEKSIRTTRPKAVRIIIAALLALSLVPAAALAGGQSAFAQTAFVSAKGADIADETDASLVTAHMEIDADGETLAAVQADMGLAAPEAGAPLDRAGAVRGDDARRALFYGDGGPEDQGLGPVLTACALSASLGNLATDAAWDAVADLRKLPAVPEGFEAMLWDSGEETSPLATWSIADSREADNEPTGGDAPNAAQNSGAATPGIAVAKASPNGPQGAGSLALAHYEFKFYPGTYFDTYEEAEKSGSTHRTWVLQTDEDGWVDLRAANGTFTTSDGATHTYKVSGDEFYYGASGYITLPLGTLTVKETKAPEGYNLSDATFIQRIKVVDGAITREGDVDIRDGNTLVDGTVEHPKRGDLKFEKKSEANASWMAGVPFKITSQTTGESHVVVTDANGQVDTSAAYNKHTNNTNFNDTAEDGAYDMDAGIWFGAGAPDDGKGAMLYDTYLIEELPCKANEGLQLVTGTAVVSKDGYMVDLGTIDDPVATIGTTATDALGGGHVAAIDEEASIIDRVDYAGLIEGGTYTLKTELMFSDDGQPVTSEGEAVAKETTFTAESTAGHVDVELTFDAMGLAGRSTTVFEELYDATGRLIAEHKDLDDAQQTVAFAVPEISTSAANAEHGGKEVVADPVAKIVDTVSYSGLAIGKEHIVRGCLMVKNVADDGTVAAEPLLDADGNTVTSSAAFTPETSAGTVDVIFEFDASLLAGRDVVVFESLEKNGKEIAAHADPNDEGQTVLVTEPEIATSATDGADGDKLVVADEEAVIVDTVSYSGLIPGREYVASGTLNVKNVGDDGTVAAEPLLDADGNTVTSSTAFVPLDTYGTVDVEFAFDASRLAGRDVVVFESLLREGIVVAEHADANDEGQTVSLASTEISTSAVDANNQDKAVVADPEAAIVDSLLYRNVVPGAEYTALGIVVDAETGLPLVTGDADENQLVAFAEALAEAMGFDLEEGKASADSAEAAAQPDISLLDALRAGSATAAIDEAVRSASVFQIAIPDFPLEPDFAALDKLLSGNAEMAARMAMARTDFVPEKASGVVEVEFPFDASALAGRTAVVYEVLLKDDSIVAAHVDVNDEAQTVEIVPSTIKTTATDKTDGDHKAIASKETVIVDEVAYDNLIVGKEYKLSGQLMLASTGKPLMVNDKPVTAEKTFVPNSSSGTVSLEFRFDSTALAGEKLVAFESLTKDGIEVASHADINDEAQTVTIVEQPKGSWFDKTGGMAGWMMTAALLLAAGAVAAAAYGFRARKEEHETQAK